MKNTVTERARAMLEQYSHSPARMCGPEKCDSGTETGKFSTFVEAYIFAKRTLLHILFIALIMKIFIV